MYNYYKFLEDKQLQEQQVSALNHQIKEAMKHQADKRQLAASYQSRLVKHLHEVMAQPIVVHNYKNPAENFVLREAQPELNLRGGQIYIQGFKKEKDRLKVQQVAMKSVIDSHRYIDATPMRSVSLHQFRDRQTSKEIQPGMKYTTSTGVERVEDYIKNSLLTEVDQEAFGFDKKKFEDQTRNLSLFEKRSYMSREISKNLLPSLHQKTYFKGMQEISNKIVTTRSLQVIKRPASFGTSPDDKGNEALIAAAANPELTSNPKQQAKSEMSTTRRNLKPKFDPAEASKKLLLQCNYTRERSKISPVLHKGQGKMFFQKTAHH